MGAFCATLLLLFPSSCDHAAGAASGCQSLTGVTYRTLEVGASNAIILGLVAASAAATLAAMVRNAHERARRRTIERKIRPNDGR
jgi:hypothetical protein